MSLLAEIDEASLPAVQAGAGGTGSAFADLLARMLRKGRR
jgi:hypothetical protein